MDYKRLTHEGVRQINPYQPGLPEAELFRRFGLKHVDKLASNENPFGPGKLALRAIRKHLNNLGQYPESPAPELVSDLAQHCNVSEDMLILGNGSSQLLELTTQLFLRPGRNMVTSQHAFIMYRIASLVQEAEVREAPARDYGYDLDAMASLIDEQTGVVFIANPNNPTGTWIKKDDLIAFMRKIPENSIIILDEAYFEYVQEPDYPNGIDLLADFPNLMVTRTFSKLHGLAALRIGYGIAAAGLAELYNRIRPPFNANHLAQVAARAALGDGKHIERSLRGNNDGRRYLLEAFERLGLASIPGIGNFITVDLGTNCEQIYQQLLQQGLIVRDLVGYGMSQHVRVTIGTAKQNQRLVKALERLI